MREEIRFRQQILTWDFMKEMFDKKTLFGVNLSLMITKPEITYSKIIESIILRVPQKNLYAIQNNEGVTTVITEVVIIFAIYKFMNNKLKLQGLEILPELNGENYKSFSDTKANLLRRITDCRLNMFVVYESIKDENHQIVKYLQSL